MNVLRKFLKTSFTATFTTGILLLILTDTALAQSTTTSANSTVTTFFNNIQTILVAIGVVAVTVAITFAGYQIAFNNKRVGEVMPVLIGGLLVGIATSVATLLVKGTT